MISRTFIFAGLTAMLSGCVSAGYHRKMITECTAQFQAEEAETRRLNQELVEKNDRLRAFNQLDGEDRLRRQEPRPTESEIDWR